MCKLDESRFRNDEAARQYLENLLWPDGPICPKCGTIGTAYKTAKPGLYRCAEAHCRADFTVTVGTVFESSKIPLHKWLLAAFLVCSSKKGMSSHQMHRTLGVTYKTAWFMTHRLREAMKDEGGIFGSGGPIEADATYVGGKEKNRHRSKRNPQTIGGVNKECVFSLVERKGGVRSFHIPNVNASNLKPILTGQLKPADTHLMTDGEQVFRKFAPMFKSHQSVNHEAGEYVRGDAHTNTVEGYFSILKRGIIGTFHHVSAHRLHRYTTEFDFRYNHRETKIKVDGKWMKVGFDDSERTIAALKGISGKRLTYRRPDAQQDGQGCEGHH
jgi:transposase-like protein